MNEGKARLAFFVVFEGIDGSGTSTQCRALKDALVAHGRPVHETFEPTKGPIGSLLRDFLGGRAQLTGDEPTDKRILAMLFAADRAHHLARPDEGILPLRARGTDVLSARYVLSSLAYEADHPDELAEVERLNAHFAVPDLTVYLKCPVEIALQRITATRSQIDIFENRAKLVRVKTNYERLLHNYPGRVLLLDATQPPQQITAAVLGALGIA